MLLKIFRIFIGFGFLLSLSASGVSQPALLDYRTDWIGNTFGYGDGKWVQNDIEAIAVTADGSVFTNTPYDEGGGELSEYKDGTLVVTAGNTHGWGNGAGSAVAVNSDYVYAAASLSNENGRLVMPFGWPSKGKVWLGISRRRRSDITQGAPFSGGLGNLTNKTARSFLLVNEVDQVSLKSTLPTVTGLAASDHDLYVSNFQFNEIRVYNAQTMVFERSWHVTRPGKISLDPNDGSLWVLSSKDAMPSVLHYSADGHLIPGSLTLPSGLSAGDIHVDKQGRILIADSGVSQQIFAFEKKGMRYALTGTIGVKFGILAQPKGQVGPLRFDGLTSIGTDDAGNLYVATNGIGASTLRHIDFQPILGATLESYTPEQKRRWVVESEAFVSGAEVDSDNPARIFSGTREFSYDYDKSTGKGWRYVATLVDRFAWPKPPLNTLGIQRIAPFYRNINGRDFLFTTDQNGGVLSIYRFDNKKNGFIPILSGMMVWNNAFHIAPEVSGTGGGVWRDVNGDGQFSLNEWEAAAKVESPSMHGGAVASWWVDRKGNVWLPRRDQGLREFLLKGLDSIGNPIYSFDSVKDFALPEPFNVVQGIQYDPNADTMFISGYTPARPYDRAHWKESGTVIARYDHWNEGNRKPSVVVNTPWDTHRKPTVTAASFYADDNFIFVVSASQATVTVFSARDGRLIGAMKPGPEVGSTSGVVDMTNAISAFRRSNGEYIILVEEDDRAKVIAYRWMPKDLDLEATSGTHAQ